MIHGGNPSVVDEYVEASLIPSNLREHLKHPRFIAHIETMMAIIRCAKIAFFAAASNHCKFLGAVILRKITPNSLSASRYQQHLALRNGHSPLAKVSRTQPCCRRF